MKRLIPFLLFTSLLLFSCQKKSIEKYTIENPLVLVMAEVNPAETIVGQMDIAFQKKVAELSGGKMSINLQLNGILGNVEDTLHLMLSENSPVQIVRITNSSLALYGCDKNALLSLPYTFKNREHFWKLMESDLASEFLNEPYEKNTGLVGLFYGEEGFRNFFSTTPVTRPEDFHGKKVRIPEDSLLNDMVLNLGGESLQAGFSEIFVSLQTGKVDIAEQPVSNYLANSFYAAAPYYILDEHTLGITEAVMSAETWNALTKEQQNIITEAGKYASSVCKEISAEVEKKSYQQLRNHGVKIIEISDKTPWKDACKTTINTYSSKHAYLYKQIERFGE